MIDIPQSARVAEYVMLRLRLTDGIDCEKFHKLFGRDFDKLYYDKLLPYINSGHILRTEKGYAFSPEGMYVSNYILSRIIDFDMNIPGA
jgi:coproporphyrinogen III oxidase-like Fe-S oxidoreductase